MNNEWVKIYKGSTNPNEDEMFHREQTYTVKILLIIGILQITWEKLTVEKDVAIIKELHRNVVNICQLQFSYHLKDSEV